MNFPLSVTDNELDELKAQLVEQKKALEYARLKKDLSDIAFKAAHELTEFDGGMQQVDTERVLKSKRDKQTFSEIFIARVVKMCNVRPIVGNLIAITLSFVGLFFLMNFLNNPELKFLKTYLGYFIEIAAAVQILKSASRSIVLPIIATILGAVISNQLTGNQLFLNHPSLFFQCMMVTGLIGICISVFTID